MLVRCLQRLGRELTPADATPLPATKAAAAIESSGSGAAAARPSSPTRLGSPQPQAEEGEPPPQYVGSAEALSLSILPPPGPSEAPLNSWDAAEVGAWVARSVRLPQYAGRFVSQEVDGTLLSVVDDEVLSCPSFSRAKKPALRLTSLEFEILTTLG